jgi:hypothetical protein
VVFTTLSLTCDIAELLKTTAASIAHTERQTNFFVNFKPYSPYYFFAEGTVEGGE